MSEHDKEKDVDSETGVGRSTSPSLGGCGM